MHVTLPLLVVFACAVGAVVMLSQVNALGAAGLVLLALFNAFYAWRVSVRGVEAPRKRLTAVSVTLGLTLVVSALTAVFVTSVNLGCRDCQGAAIILVLPMLGAAVLAVLSVALQVWALTRL